MKKTILNIICFPLKCLEFIILGVLFLIIFILVQPFIWCKTKGKNNLNKNDEARVFVSNHYEIYGPIVVFLRFPYKFRPWVIDKMTNAKEIKQQASIGFYNKYKWIPKWIKTILLFIAQRFILFIIKLAKPIPVSRDNPRKNVITMQKSAEVLNKKMSIFIWPELCSVSEGVGEFMSGFEHLGKYYYQKTGKKISFYPVFTSRKNKTMYIEKPIIFNPDSDSAIEKQRIVNELRNSMIESYLRNEKKQPSKDTKNS